MNSNSIVKYYGLKCGDRLSRKKGVFPWQQATYIGIHNGLPMVAEKSRKNVRYISLDEFLLWGVATISGVYRFSGKEEDRKNIIPEFNRLIAKHENVQESPKNVNAALVGFGLLAMLGGLLISDMKN